MSLIRKAVISIEEVEKILKPVVMENLKTNKMGSFKNNVKTSPIEIKIAGEKIYALSDRYKTFFVKGYKCVNCGIEGTFFALEAQKDNTANTDSGIRYHLNLYGYDKEGNEVLMTKDHIVPKSKGGKNRLENYQPMCAICNREKGDRQFF